MELTKEHFEQAIKDLSTKQDLKATETRLVKRIGEAQDELAQAVAETIATPMQESFDQIKDMLTVKEDVETLKRQQVAAIYSTLNLSPKN